MTLTIKPKATDITVNAAKNSNTANTCTDIFMCMSKWDIYILRECSSMKLVFFIKKNITKHGDLTATTP